MVYYLNYSILNVLVWCIFCLLLKPTNSSYCDSSIYWNNDATKEFSGLSGTTKGYLFKNRNPFVKNEALNHEPLRPLYKHYSFIFGTRYSSNKYLPDSNTFSISTTLIGYMMEQPCETFNQPILEYYSPLINKYKYYTLNDLTYVNGKYTNQEIISQSSYRTNFIGYIAKDSCQRISTGACLADCLQCAEDAACTKQFDMGYGCWLVCNNKNCPDDCYPGIDNKCCVGNSGWTQYGC